MNLTAIDLNLLVAFEALMLERSVSGAARRLCLGQPATSAALSRLRRLFGDELFVRAGGAMQPTPKALALSEGIADSLARIRATLSRNVPFAAEAAARTFIIGSTDYTSQIIVPAIMREIGHIAPAVDVRVIAYDKSDFALLLDRGEVDIILGVFPHPPERCVKTRLFHEHFVGVARRDHPIRAMQPLSLADFAAAPHALVTVRRDSEGIVDQVLRSKGLKRRIALTVPHMMALPLILRETDLVAILPRRIVANFNLDDLGLFDLPVDVPSFAVEMIWNPVARSDSASAWLRTTVLAAVSSLRVDGD